MSTEYTKLLMYFILTIGVVLIGVLVISFVELQKANQEIQYGRNDLTQANEKLNKTLSKVNQTQLFLQQSEHEDKAREAQTQIEMQGRSNQTKFILNNTQTLLQIHHDGLVNLYKEFRESVERQNNTTDKLFKEVSDAQKQNEDIMDTLVKIHSGMINDTKDTNQQVSKYGPENNALGREILKQMGINASDIIDRDVYSNQTLKEMITK